MSAIDYARWIQDTMGLQIVPLYGPTFGPGGAICRCRDGASCSAPGKHPAARWKGQPSRLPNPFQNYAVVLDRYVVVDVDDRSVLDDLTMVLGFELPDTWAIDTGKGRHFWFRHTEPLATRLGWRPKIDLKSGHTYVVGPGSTSITGTIYEPINTLPIAPAPAALVEACGQPRDHGASRILHPVPQTTLSFAVPWIEGRIAEMATTTTRNNTLLRLTCEFLRAGTVGEDMIQALAEAAMAAGLSAEEVRRTQDSARRMVVLGE